MHGLGSRVHRASGLGHIAFDVGPRIFKASPIMCFGACLFGIRAMIARPPIMCFDLGALKI